MYVEHLEKITRGNIVVASTDRNNLVNSKYKQIRKVRPNHFSRTNYKMKVTSSSTFTNKVIS